MNVHALKHFVKNVGQPRPLCPFYPDVGLGAVKLTKQCFYYLKPKGSSFVPEANAMPLCAAAVG
jgi:hypothetical protein